MSQFSLYIRFLYFRPDTGELGLRAGLHSGPVTAGVLRGEKSRFQLFGDTVNTGTVQTPGLLSETYQNDSHFFLFI